MSIRSKIPFKKILFLFLLFAYTALNCILKLNVFRAQNDALPAGTPMIPAAVLSIVFLLFGCMVFAMASYAVLRETSIASLARWSILLFGIAYLLAFAPTAVPDEPVHFASAYYLSNFLCCPSAQMHAEGVVMRADDLRILQTQFDNFQSSANYLQTIENFHWFCKDSAYLLCNIDTAVVNAPLGYLFSALAITMGRVLHLGLYPIFYLGRLINVVVYSLLISLAIRRTPVGKVLIFIIALLPISLHEAASFSYDPYAISFTMLFVANILYWTFSDAQMHTKDILFCVFLGILVSITKVVYSPLILLVFAIPNKNVADLPTKAYLYKLAVVFACISFFVILCLPVIFTVLTSEDLNYVASESYTISWVLYHIPATISIFFRTIYYRWSEYLSGLLGIALGWFQVGIDLFSILPLEFFFFTAAICEEKPEMLLTPPQRTLFGFPAFFSALLVLASMFFAWTPFPSPLIEGVQGRYFLPILFPTVMCMKSGWFHFDYKKQNILLGTFLVYDYILLTDYIISSCM